MLRKWQGAKEIGHNLALERPKFGHNLACKRQNIGHSLERERVHTFIILRGKLSYIDFTYLS